MKQYGSLLLLVIVISGCVAQDPTTPPNDWNGDPLVCTPNAGPPGRPYPQFPNIAEFTLERVETKILLGTVLPSELTLYQYLYDYDANKLILIKNANGFIDAEYFYYEQRKKSTYYRGDACVVSDIAINIEMDGTSAIQSANGTWHIRPLNEFLLFSSEDPRKPAIRPRFIGQSIVRGMLVNQWETCLVDKATFRTVRRQWSFADQSVVMPFGPVGNLAVPVEAIIRASVDFPNGTQAIEVDEVFNVHSFRAGIIESTDELAPPRGVFCSNGDDQNLISLRDIAIEWPERFSVRVEASSSRSAQWQGFHLRYDRGRDRGSRRLRYDYLPPGSQDYRTVIHDYGDSLTYTIDQRAGSCKISGTVNLPDVNPIRNPIEFFIANEERFIFSPREKAWEFNGFRSCRGVSTKCTVVTTSVDNFPPLIDPETGNATGETWAATNIEYGWSMRAPLAPPPPDTRKTFDYPVNLYLKMYRFNDAANPSLFNLRTEDLEYEFFEMSHELNPWDFDTSICYRSNNSEYLHLGMVLNLERANLLEGNNLNRRLFERDLHLNLIDKMKVRYSRISGLEIDHERATNEVNVFFTLLGRIPKPGATGGVADNEPTAKEASDNLAKVINEGKFEFMLRFGNETDSGVKVVGRTSSLKSSKQFMSTHVAGRRVVKESYSSGSQAAAIIFGSIIGALLGVLLVGIVRVVRKEPMPVLPSLPTSITNPLPNISFYNKKTPAAPAATPEP